MANHKRKRPKNRRAGCLMCKPHKANHAKKHGLKEKQYAAVKIAREEIGGYGIGDVP